jgi:uncharacterized protein YaiE (UPF0345 family)
MANTSIENATIVKKANIYYEGKVTSRTVHLSDGSKVTLGVMLPGEYEFNTAAAETMEVLGGQMTVLLPGREDWQTFETGQSYDVPSNSSFKLKIETVADYCCSYK